MLDVRPMAMWEGVRSWKLSDPNGREVAVVLAAGPTRIEYAGGGSVVHTESSGKARRNRGIDTRSLEADDNLLPHSK